MGPRLRLHPSVRPLRLQAGPPRAVSTAVPAGEVPGPPLVPPPPPGWHPRRPSPHLQPFDGLLAAWGEQHALVQAGHGGGAAGQGRERGRGAHAHQGVGHCGEIVRGWTQLRPATVTVIVLKVGHVYGRKGRRGRADRREGEKRKTKLGKSKRQVKRGRKQTRPAGAAWGPAPHKHMQGCPPPPRQGAAPRARPPPRHPLERLYPPHPPGPEARLLSLRLLPGRPAASVRERPPRTPTPSTTLCCRCPAALLRPGPRHPSSSSLPRAPTPGTHHPPGRPCTPQLRGLRCANCPAPPGTGICPENTLEER